MRIGYTKYTKESGMGGLEFGFIFSILPGVPQLMLVGGCTFSEAHTIGAKLDAAEWAAKAVVAAYQNPPPEAA